jgi:23S rRNA (pseudouridine1915-N3)-methyltransferase
MHLIAVGRLREGPEAALFQLYNTRLRPRLTVAEVAQGRGGASVIKRKEGTALLAALPKSAFVERVRRPTRPGRSRLEQ